MSSFSLRYFIFVITLVLCAYRIMTGVKRLDKVRNTMVLRSVSRNDLIHTVHDRQLRFLGHMLRNTHSPHAIAYALYQPTHGTTRRGRPRLNYMDYIEKLTGMKVCRATASVRRPSGITVVFRTSS